VPAVVLLLLGALTVSAVPSADDSGDRPAAYESGGPLRRPGAAPLPDSVAARRVQRSAWEPRPGNASANRTVPTARQLAAFRRRARGQDVAEHVTGAFRGTTDEIIQWASHKWGLPVNLMRARAVAESTWHQRHVGDSGRSYGLMQVKRTVWRGSYPLSRRSTAFNVDLSAAIMRQAYDGRATWLKREGYRKGDLWGSLGFCFSGRWYDAGARAYIDRVRRHLEAQSWLQPGF
jgi:hypothetical protein